MKYLVEASASIERGNALDAAGGQVHSSPTSRSASSRRLCTGTPLVDRYFLSLIWKARRT